MDAPTPEEALRAAGGTTEQCKPPPSIENFLKAEAWLERDFPEPEPMLGELILAGVRMFVVGRTGLGKTMLGLAMAVAISTGKPFLHWRAGTKPRRVLYLDGEMPGALMRQRLRDAVRRAGNPSLGGRLFVFGHDVEDEAAKLFPHLGLMPSLNTPEGQKWILALIDALGGVDAIFLDNVMSLTAGIQKDEDSWTGANPLVQELSRRHVAQVWLDHTGHDGSHQYGTSTKSWRFDVVALMLALSEDDRRPHELAFTLSFEPPGGKARRRTPENWRDFETATIRLVDDQWTSESAGTTKKGPSVKPSRKLFYDALVAVLTTSATEPGKTTIGAWQTQCMRRGLIDKATEGDEPDYHARHVRFQGFRAAKHDLLAAGWIAIEDDVVCDLRGSWS